MLTADRKALVLSTLATDGRVIAGDLARVFGTSEDTIRRDLRDLARLGLLTRVHGGALPASPTHRPLAERRVLHPEAKHRLGQAGARLIQPGQVVIVDGGTTHLALIAALPPDLRATVVTHSPPIAAALEAFAGIEVIVIGGRLMRHSMVALGAATQAGYAALNADLCFLGVTGLHPEAGLTTGDHDEAQIKARMILSAAETVALVTPDKLGTTSPYRIAPLAALATLITTGPRPDWLPAATTHHQA